MSETSALFLKNIGHATPLFADLKNRSCSTSEAVGGIVWKEIKKTIDAMKKK